MTLDRLRLLLLEEFQPPFVADGLVDATFVMRGERRLLSVRIAGRDVTVDEEGADSCDREIRLVSVSTLCR